MAIHSFLLLLMMALTTSLEVLLEKISIMPHYKSLWKRMMVKKVATCFSSLKRLNFINYAGKCSDLLPEFGANSVIIMLRGFSVATVR